MYFNDFERNLGGQIVKWDSIFNDLPKPIAKLTQYTMEHPGCFNFTDHYANFEEYFKGIYKPNMSFSDLIELIFYNPSSLNLLPETIELYRNNASKFFFRILCFETTQKNISTEKRRIISKIFSNIYINCAFGYTNGGLVYGFKKFNSIGQTFCKFTPKTPILKETIYEMSAFADINVEKDGVYCLLRLQDSSPLIYPFNWENQNFDYIV